MATTFTKIASVSVGVLGASSIDFTSIPSTYTDLCVKVSARGTSANYWDNIILTFNGNTSSYSQKILASADGSAVSAQASASGISYLYEVGSLSTSNTFGNADVYVPNYAGSTNKSVSIDTVSENNGTQILLGLTAGLWSNTAAINRLTITPATGTLVQYSTAVLYGINKS
jgi:hypothetical protein